MKRLYQVGSLGCSAQEKNANCQTSRLTSIHVSNPVLSEDGITSPVMVITVMGDDDGDDGDDDRCCLTKSPTSGLVMMLQKIIS